MNLSKNFTLAEMTKSQEALRRGIDNTPDPFIQKNLQLLCENVLQPIRDHFGPVNVSSGYRSKALNDAVNGSKVSDHMAGCAADIEVSVSNLELAKWIAENLSFTQLILEFYSTTDPRAGWVHVSYVKDNLKKQLLTATKVNGKVVYTNGLG
jgi:hypothetical protein